MTAWTRGVMARLGLEINGAKTSVKNARVERFDFLGYTFGPHWRRRDGKEYPGASPSKKSIGRLRDKVSYTLVPFNPGPFFSRVGPEVRDQLNAKLRGWAEFSDKTIFGDLGVVRLLRSGNKNQPWALP
jgi:RNA-directed DNA polymerase